MSRATTTLRLSSAKRSKKDTDDTLSVKLCYHNPETLVDLGPNSNNTGIIFCCKKCSIVDTILWDEIMSVHPLTFKRPML